MEKAQLPAPSLLAGWNVVLMNGGAAAIMDHEVGSMCKNGKKAMAEDYALTIRETVILATTAGLWASDI